MSFILCLYLALNLINGEVREVAVSMETETAVKEAPTKPVLYQ